MLESLSAIAELYLQKSRDTTDDSLRAVYDTLGIICTKVENPVAVLNRLRAFRDSLRGLVADPILEEPIALVIQLLSRNAA